MDKSNPPSYKETIVDVEKINPPSYEETIAAGPSPYSQRTNTAYISEGAGPSLYSERTNTPYVSEAALRYAPTAPSIGVIESVGAPLLSISPLTDKELREALYQHKKDFGIFGAKFIQDMTITNIHNDCAFHYKLESFGEKRDCAPRYAGYHGQKIDGTENGSAPDKWSVPVNTPPMFIDHEITREVPHSAYVKECNTCEGEKKIDCTPFWANGKIDCQSCEGRGKDTENHDCWTCKGSGNKKCSKCSGRGTIDCSFCDGFGKVKYYMLLTVTWKNHSHEFVSNRHNLPEELILKEKGQEIFTKEANQVEPLNTAHGTLNEASAILIENHHSSIKNKAILAQRHSLRAVPFTRATYVCRNKKGEFYVYGFERKVHFEEHPHLFSGCAIS